MKLRNLFQRFSREKTTKDMVPDVGFTAEEEQALPQIVANFFPKDGTVTPVGWADHDNFEDSSFPFHTNDKIWLAKRLYQVMRSADLRVNYKACVNYVGKSPAFKAQKLAYQQRLIKKQIEIMVSGHSDVADENQTPDENIQKDKNFDKYFRKSLVAHLRKLNLDTHAIEIGLELNAVIWRPQCQQRTFLNRYHPQELAQEAEKCGATLIKPQDAHRTDWLTMREHQYYFEHKEVIDEVGAHTPAMLLPSYVTNVLSARLIEHHHARMAVLNRCERVTYGLRKMTELNKEALQK